jgi:hypothetical protein
MKATYRPKEYLINGKIEFLQPGQFIAGRKSLSKETGIQESKIERILYCFTNEHQIEQQTTNKFRIITILNWSKYQAGEQQIEQQMNNQRTTSEQPVNTNNKDKKEKKVKNKYRVLEIPPSLEDVTAYCRERGRGINPQAWMDFYASKGWMVGANKMKDWKAAVRTWEHSRGGGGNGQGIRTARSDPRDSSLQNREDAEVQSALALWEAAKKSPRSDSGGDAPDDDAPDF